ncbi:hypothetical protein QE152_g32439 [Popillia japonica]|uniref:Uncharacterized protein n=1 Tax=Popillia japonica TaxID=7064 RepID=A0AAW1IZG0_POPJA
MIQESVEETHSNLQRIGFGAESSRRRGQTQSANRIYPSLSDKHIRIIDGHPPSQASVGSAQLAELVIDGRWDITTTVTQRAPGLSLSSCPGDQNWRR